MLVVKLRLLARYQRLHLGPGGVPVAWMDNREVVAERLAGGGRNRVDAIDASEIRITIDEAGDQIAVPHSDVAGRCERQFQPRAIGRQGRHILLLERLAAVHHRPIADRCSLIE
jgi:hypothetical protein